MDRRPRAVNSSPVRLGRRLPTVPDAGRLDTPDGPTEIVHGCPDCGPRTAKDAVTTVNHASNVHLCGRRRRRAAALAACHLLLLVALPAAHAALPVHEGGAAAHACPLCQSFHRGIDAVPAGSAVAAPPVPRAVPLAPRPPAAVPATDDHAPGAPRAPPPA